MAAIKSNISILVHYENTEYRVNPLFLPYPEFRNRRFELAISQLKKEIRTGIQRINFSRNVSEPLLWLLFNPPLQSKILKLSLTVGKQFMEGQFLYVHYSLQDMTFVLLPEFNQFQFIADAESPLDQQVQRVIENLIKSYKKEIAFNQKFDVVPYTTPTGSFIHQLDINLDIRQGPFSFEKPPADFFFSQLNQEKKFEGATEIYRVGYDLTDRFPAELKRAYERSESVRRVGNALFKGNRTPLVLIGERGVGKEAIIHEALYLYLDDDQQKGARQKIWFVDPNRIIAGMSVIGWWQKRFEAIIRFVKDRLANDKSNKTNLTDILFFDNPVAMMRIGQSAQNSLTLTNVILPYLEKRQVGVIISATPEEWKLVQEKDRRFADLFQIIRIAQPSYKNAARIVIQQRRELEILHNATFTILAIDHLFTFQRNYLSSQALPGSVMRIMNQLATRYRNQQIDLPEVRTHLQKISGMDQQIFDQDYIFEKGEVRKAIGTVLVGQPAAVDTLVDTIHLIKARLTNPARPLGSFLFIGPTGVGKTQAAKVLCRYLQGSEDQLMRFDMNEYIDASAVDRLIGNYHQPEGQLTGKVRYQPFGILLLDEIEKAHPSVHDLLLQVLDDGRLTDSVGRTVDFTNTIIIMTSNVGAREVSVRLGFDTGNRQEGAIYRKAMEKKFRPEFINRIDQIVIFDPLQLTHILSIARLQIKELLSRDGFVRRATILNISQEALEWVARRGYDARMGGRALKRQIERDLTMLSAEQLIATKSDLPILFNIDIVDNQLVPTIQPLEFMEALSEGWLPQLPEPQNGKRFYSQQLHQVRRLEDQIRRMEDREASDGDELIMIQETDQKNLNWHYYNFKDKIAAIKEKITAMNLGYGSSYFREMLAHPLRLKGVTLPPHGVQTKADRSAMKDRFFQEEGIREIADNYRYAATSFDGLATEFLSTYVDVQFMKIFTAAFLKDEIDDLVIKFTSCIDGLGQEEITFLMEQYEQFFEDLDLLFEMNKKQNSIRVEGYGIARLLKGEMGLSLFYKAHQNPIPIRLEMNWQNGTAISQAKVLRLFDQQGTMTDLRTGFANVAKSSASEFKVFVYAGLWNEKR